MKALKKDNIMGYEAREPYDKSITSEAMRKAILLEEAIREVNAFRSTTTADNKQRVRYIHPDGRAQMVFKRFKDGKEVTLEYLRGIVIKAAEDRGISFKQVLKVGGWIC